MASSLDFLKTVSGKAGGRCILYSVCQLPAATILYLAQKISATRRAETRDLGQTAGLGSLSLDGKH